jgi:hypothetical protein
MALVQGETERLVSFHIDASPSSQRALELALTTVLRHKGRVLDSLTEAQRTLRDHLTPPLRGQLDQLAQARSELAAQLYATAKQRAATQRAEAIATLRTRIDDLEATLSAANAEFRAQNEPVTLANVQAALPPGAMLIELVRYRRFDARAQPPWQEERYVAYLVISHGSRLWPAAFAFGARHGDVPTAPRRPRRSGRPGRYFSTPPMTDKEATKEALAALIGPTILHVATHGFYARDPGTTRAPGSRGPSAPPSTASVPRAPRGMKVEIADGMSSLFPPPLSSDPAEGLDRSGLAMAGANQGAGGIVTAREIAGFDWWGTQLVVLSACETGVGAVPSGDGVYGMRHALVLAGAESQTRALMRDYYGELARGTGRAEALRSAKLHMLHQPRYAHPYYWAAFIPAGDWRPLVKNTMRR